MESVIKRVNSNISPRLGLNFFAILFFGIVYTSGQETGTRKLRALSVDMFMPYTIPTGNLAELFSPRWGGVGINTNLIFGRYSGIFAEFSMSAPDIKSEFSYNGDWKLEHKINLVGLEGSWIFLNFIPGNSLISFFSGPGLAWLATNGSKNNNLNSASLGIIPTINLGALYAHKKIRPLGSLAPELRLSIKVEYKYIGYGLKDDRFEGGVTSIAIGVGVHGSVVDSQ